MSRDDRSERVGVLRDAIARIEGDGSLMPRFEARGGPAKVALGGDLGLDRALGGGLRPGTLTEVVAHRPGDAGATSGFALALAVRFAAESRKTIVWILQDAARAETGTPYAPGLAAHGVDLDRLVIVKTASGPDTLWAMEEALKCRAVAAVLADLWRTKTYDLVASRRLVLAAQKNGTPGLLIPAGAAGSAAALSSAAQVRFEIAAAPSRALASAGGQMPLPGRAAWAVRLARIRAGPSGTPSVDGEKVWPLIWDHHAALFQEAGFSDALPLPPPALSSDRPHPPAALDWHAA